jgi:hypothetical protein
MQKNEKTIENTWKENAENPLSFFNSHSILFLNQLDNTSKETMRQLQQLWVKFLEQKLAHMEYTQNVSRWHQSL